MLRAREYPVTLAEAFHCCFDDNCFIMARAASYSALLSLFPGLIFVTALLFSGDANRTIAEISIALGQVLPPEVDQLVLRFMTISIERSRLVLFIAGLAAVLFSADLMATLMEGMRLAYRAPRRSSMWRDYGMATALVFFSIIPLTVANLTLILSRQIQTWASRTFQTPGIAEGVHLTWWMVAFLTFTAVIALLYYIAPNRRQRWRDVAPGAALASAFWLPMTALFTFYVQAVARYSVFYGNVSTVIVLLIWTYLGCVIVLFGAEFNAARERRLGTLPPRKRPRRPSSPSKPVDPISSTLLQ